jgi:integrase
MAQGVIRRGNKFQAWAWDPHARKKIYKTFDRERDAKAWRNQTNTALARREISAGSKMTFRQAAEAWLEGAESGAIRKKGGRVYKANTLLSYRETLHRTWTTSSGAQTGVLHDLGSRQVGKIDRQDMQALVARLQTAGLAGASVRLVISSARIVFAEEVHQGRIAVNPAAGLRLPASDGQRDRIPAPAEAVAYLEAIRPEDRPLWATAVYAGLRRGEILALRWNDIDFEHGMIRVDESYSAKTGTFGSPKTESSKRKVPMVGTLKQILATMSLERGVPSDETLVFGNGTDPIEARSLVKRAATDAKRAGLGFEPFGLHECRHGYASTLIAAGVNPKAVSTYMGHASISITFDRYGHLFPGAEDEARDLQERYLESVVQAVVQAA